jgi:lipopolysaccharide export system permease protein
MQQFIPVFIVALTFFVLLLELGDLFANLWKYISNDVPAAQIAQIMWLYVPKCISFSMPLSVLFAAAYTMGNMYARNELTSIFAAGFPLYSLVFPLLVFGFILSLFMFFFEDRVVIHTQYRKSALNRVLLNQDQSLSNANIVVLSESGTIVYTAEYYQDAEQKLYQVFIIERSSEGSLKSIIQASSATWGGSSWKPENPSVWVFDGAGSMSFAGDAVPVKLVEDPATFRRNVVNVDELGAHDAKNYIKSARKAGLPYAEMLSDYYKRFSFPFTIFIVLFFSISLGGRFRKNIMLMSLLLSLSVAVLYYVTQMITMLFAKWEYISPLAGAWFPVLLFVSTSIVLLRNART